jgi:hypothetical protein
LEALSKKADKESNDTLVLTQVAKVGPSCRLETSLVPTLEDILKGVRINNASLMTAITAPLKLLCDSDVRAELSPVLPLSFGQKPDWGRGCSVTSCVTSALATPLFRI